MSKEKKNSVFRPWDGDDTSTTRSIRDITIKYETINGNRSPSLNSENNRESESPCSTKSVSDFTENEISRLTKFVLGTKSNDDVYRRDSTSNEGSMVNNSSHSSNSPIPLSPQSAFAPTLSYNMYPGFMGSFTSNGTFIPYEVYSPHSGFYALSAISTAECSYYDEILRINQQDVAAKQMKKLRPKKFPCSDCGAAFSNNGQLKGHMRIHTGERPFKCDHKNCDKSFTRNEELTRHKRIHTGLRPHICVVCNKGFGRKDHLKKHTRTHENRGSYQLPPFGSFVYGHPSLLSGNPLSSNIFQL